MLVEILANERAAISQKRKLSHEPRHTGNSEGGVGVDTSKPTAVFAPTGGGRTHTVSVALPGSIISK